MVKTSICDQYGIDFPLFAFSHCRDVVAAVTNAGGLGVLGGVAFTPDQLEQELTWIDDHVNGKPYGVDIIVPAKYEGKDIVSTHANMHISNPEFEAAVGDLKATLDKLQIPNTEQKELLAIVESTRPQIVTVR